MTDFHLRERLLGIDHGDRHLGIALSDALWLTARPLQILKRKTNVQDFAAIAALVTLHEVKAVIVGLPVHEYDTQPSPGVPTRASTVRRWATRLAAALSVKVYLWDETLSSQDAAELADRRPPGSRIDDEAAAVILRSFMAAHPVGTPLPLPVKRRA